MSAATRIAHVKPISRRKQDLRTLSPSVPGLIVRSRIMTMLHMEFMEILRGEGRAKSLIRAARANTPSFEQRVTQLRYRKTARINFNFIAIRFFELNIHSIEFLTRPRNHPYSSRSTIFHNEIQMNRAKSNERIDHSQERKNGGKRVHLARFTRPDKTHLPLPPLFRRFSRSSPTPFPPQHSICIQFNRSDVEPLPAEIRRVLPAVSNSGTEWWWWWW